MTQLLLQLWHIFYFIVSPLLVLAGLGFAIQRLLGLDMPTLTRLNFYFVIPGVIYGSLLQSTLTATDVAKVVAFSLAVMVSLAALTYVVAALRGVPREMRAAMVMTSMFYNSANYGLPLQELAFRGKGTVGDQSASSAAVSLQVFVMLVQSISTFTIGVVLAASGGRRRSFGDVVSYISRFPPIYAMTAGVLTILARNWLGEDAPTVAAALRPFSDVANYVKEAFIAVALCTLGAQLALVRSGDRQVPISLSVALRLLGGPLIGLGLVHAFGFEGLLAQVLLLSTTTPTAVNAMLLSVEFDNHPDLVARSVFYSMLLSPVTVTLTIFFTETGIFGIG